MYCKEMVKILKCYLYAKKSYGTLSKGAIFLANPVYYIITLQPYLAKKSDKYLFVIGFRQSKLSNIANLLKNQLVQTIEPSNQVIPLVHNSTHQTLRITII